MSTTSKRSKESATGFAPKGDGTSAVELAAGGSASPDIGAASSARRLPEWVGGAESPVRLRDESDNSPLRDELVGKAINRVGLKVGLVVSVIVGVVMAASLIPSQFESWYLLIIAPLVSGLGAYFAVVWIVARRLRLAHSVLRQIRKHQFDNLEAAHLPKGDEINGLIWQVYRTGQVLEKEMSELRRMEDSRREFLGNVSHELKTPIFAIRGFAETLQNGALEDREVNRSFVDKIVRNADRLSNLAKDLGEISRIETGELKMVMAPFRIQATVSEAMESLEPLAELRKVTLLSRISADVPRVMGEADHLRQVLVNLMENAVKYNREGGTVEVVARLLPSGVVKVSVVDNGIGIPPEHLSRITERFYRVDRSRSRAQGGTGLGLAIVKHILGAHGTALRVESRPGAGSTFGFFLPSAEAPA